MNKELSELGWLNEQGIGNLFRRFTEDKLREVIKWLDVQEKDVYQKIHPILKRELDRRAAEAYEAMNGGEWI